MNKNDPIEVLQVGNGFIVRPSLRTPGMMIAEEKPAYCFRATQVLQNGSGSTSTTGRDCERYITPGLPRAEGRPVE